MIPNHLFRFVNIESTRLLLDSSLPYILSIPFKSNMQKLLRSSFPTDLSQTKCKKIAIDAIYGIMELEVNKYLVVVKESKEVASINEKSVMRVERVEFIPLAEQVAKQDIPHIESLLRLFNLKQFYYSDQYLLTETMDRVFRTQTADRNGRYFFNSHWVKQLYEIEAQEWVTGFISGMVQKHSFTMNREGQTNNCDLLIISRRDKTRQGARWLCRGTDGEGNAVNMTSTEQILMVRKGQHKEIYSFVQLRGSIPFKWQQKPDMKWAPASKITGTKQQNLKIVRSHFQQLKTLYPECTIINLVSKTKSCEKVLGSQYEQLVQNLHDRNIRFIWFDFLAACKGMKYQNLSQLIDMIKYSINEYGYTHIRFDNEIPVIKRVQKGVFRVNCMDCLDRTNVVQSVIARNVLQKQLNDVIEYSQDELEKFSTKVFEKLPTKLIETQFRQAWTNNGDVISVLYAGTPAMKRDFTLHGKRTFVGAIEDGIFALKRYNLGNFYDYQRQNANDILTDRLNLKLKRVHKPKTNPLFLIFACVIATPIVVSLVIDWIVDFDSVDNLHHNVKDKYFSDIAVLFYKLLGSIVGMFSMFKVFQSETVNILNRPTLDD